MKRTEIRRKNNRTYINFMCQGSFVRTIFMTNSFGFLPCVVLDWVECLNKLFVLLNDLSELILV